MTARRDPEPDDLGAQVHRRGMRVRCLPDVKAAPLRLGASSTGRTVQVRDHEM
jgi:hypothetical protein